MKDLWSRIDRQGAANRFITDVSKEGGGEIALCIERPYMYSCACVDWVLITGCNRAPINVMKSTLSLLFLYAAAAQRESEVFVLRDEKVEKEREREIPEIFIYI